MHEATLSKGPRNDQISTLPFTVSELLRVLYKRCTLCCPLQKRAEAASERHRSGRGGWMMQGDLSEPGQDLLQCPRLCCQNGPGPSALELNAWQKKTGVVAERVHGMLHGGDD